MTTRTSHLRHTLRTLPALVAGIIGCGGDGGRATQPVGFAFASVSSGAEHSCALTTSGAAYCWGYNGSYSGFGPLGDGSVTPRSVPVAVTGDLTFSSVSPGREHTCGLTTNGAAYCWGFNVWGQLGNGSTEDAAVPVAVSGGLTFAGLSAGGTNSCGVNRGGIAYCWGDHIGKSSTVPVRVDGGP